jgi:flavodoxin
MQKATNPHSVSTMKSLVVYYTRTGTAKFVAETVAAELGSDVEQVVDLKKREGKLGWLIAGRDATGEKLTKIAPATRSIADYDLIVIGQPVWAWRPTPAIRTYVKQNDLTGKKVALFFTCDSNPKEAIEKTKALMPKAVFVGDLFLSKALANKEDTLKKVVDWCQTLKG